ncbi:MAG TPA: thioredoxin [Blastocatellia bacterium]|nr:thioredoxin [Blastocatellia bacterium]
MSQLVREVKDEEFELEVLKSSQPVLVDFWAAWCAPCRAIAPAVEAIAQKYQGKAKVVKLNVDENNSSPSNYGVRGIPTLILFRDGAEVERIIGLPLSAQESISKILDKHVPE